ncbi:MAG TPA: periplasmic heavy metal sensor, partial [Bacillota bacterium]|nr:periplasmic heavy metal sensor [Bacillota bacterium]
MKKTISVILTTGLLLGTVSFGVMAKGRDNASEMFRGQHRFGHHQMRMRNLDLTAEQQKQILAIRQEFQKDTQELRFEHQKLQLELRQLWDAKPLNQKEIEKKTQAAAALEVQLTAKNQAMSERINKVLTAEQLKKIDTRKTGPGRQLQKRTFKGKGQRGRLGTQLGLTADQQQKVLDLRQNFQKDTLALRQSLQQKQLELRLLWEAKPLNQKLIEAKS